MKSAEGGSPTFSTLLANGCFSVGLLRVKECRGSGGCVAFLERTDALSKDRKAEGVVEHQLITVGARCCPVPSPLGVLLPVVREQSQGSPDQRGV